MSSIPFSIRTATAVSVFACLFIAGPQGAQQLAGAPVGTLQSEYEALLNVYLLLIRQPTANNRSDLYAAVLQAAIAVCNLKKTLMMMTASGDDEFTLQNFQTVNANAMIQIQAAQSNEDDGQVYECTSGGGGGGGLFF